MHPRSRPQVRSVLPSSTETVIAAQDEKLWECLPHHKPALAAGPYCASSAAWGSVLQQRAVY